MQIALVLISDSEHWQHVLRRAIVNLYFPQQPTLFSSLEDCLFRSLFSFLFIAAVDLHETIVPKRFCWLRQIWANEILIIFNCNNVFARQAVGCLWLQRKVVSLDIVLLNFKDLFNCLFFHKSLFDYFTKQYARECIFKWSVWSFFP